MKTAANTTTPANNAILIATVLSPPDLAVGLEPAPVVAAAELPLPPVAVAVAVTEAGELEDP